MRITIALLLAILLGGPAAEAQFSPGLQRRLQTLNAKPQQQWTNEDFLEMENVMFAMAREMLFSQLTPGERQSLSSIVIRGSDRDDGTPGWLDGNAIYVSRTALGDLLYLGFLIGHDLYVSINDRFPLRSSSILLRPYAVSRLLPLVTPLDMTAFYRTPQELIKCPNQVMLCVEPQAMASVIGTVGFVIAHEMAHKLLGHGSGARDREQELAADAKAWAMIMAVAPEVSEDDYESLEYRVRSAMQAGPKIVVRWLADRSGDDASREEADLRQIAFDDLVTDDVRGTVGSITDPATMFARLKTVQIGWSEEPERLFINGNEVTPREVQGRQLRLLTDVKVFAVRAGMFAYGEVSNRGADSLMLTFSAPKAAGSASELKSLERERNWFELFLRSTDRDLRPRSSDAVRQFHQALSRMKLGVLIDSNEVRLSASERRTAQFWRNRSEALATWRAE